MPLIGSTSSFGAFVAATRRARGLVVQPRMGLSGIRTMRRGLEAVRDSGLPVVGTLTLDSYTRVGDHDGARAALEAGRALNGYPLLAHDASQTAAMVHGILAPDFPIQVRHGSARPERIFARMVAAGLSISEGGPVSYCLPYSRIPLREATESWTRATRGLVENAQNPHLESFGGCLLGQLCPPGLLVAVSVLECMFFAEHGIRDMSASYAQQTNLDQDAEALSALRRLLREHLPGVDWHVVLYTYMGLFPDNADGARQLLRESGRLAARTGTERLIVKTVAEAHRIPTIAENLDALRLADAAARESSAEQEVQADPAGDTEVYREAALLVDEVLNCASTITEALPAAFERGLLDVPYCLHPDNRNLARSTISPDGRLEWCSPGLMPLRVSTSAAVEPVGTTKLLFDLNYHRRRLRSRAGRQEDDDD